MTLEAIIKLTLEILKYAVPGGLASISLLLHAKKSKSHKDCKLYPSLIERDEIKEKIQRIKEKSILKDQMNCLSTANAEIMFLIRKVYLELNPNAGSIQHYNLILNDAKEEIKETVRKWFRENHYTSRTEQNWLEYKVKHRKGIIDIAVYHLDSKHKDELGVFNVKRSDLEQLNHEKVIPMALAIYDKMFDDCREIAREYEAMIEQLELSLVTCIS